MQAKKTLSLAAFALAAAAPLAAQQAPSRDSLIVRRPYVVGRDSVIVRSMTGNEAELMRVVNELREREARLLRELVVTAETEQATRRRLVEELQRVSREAFTVMSVIESRCLDERTAASDGYLGINITTEMKVRDRDAVAERSVITSVEPGSPAERAGVLAGDRLLSIGGRDATDSFPNIAGLLEPGRRVLLRVERDGSAREVPVVAGVRPQYYKVTSCPSFERALRPLRMGAVGRVWMTDTTDAQGNRFVFVTPAIPSRVAVGPRQPTAAAAPSATPAPSRPSTTAPTPLLPSTVSPATPAPAAAPSPPMAVWGTAAVSGSAVTYFGGAQFRALDDDWRGVLRLREGTQGVFVNEVAPGSAAAQAGLRVGDVVTHVNDAAATSPYVVLRLLGVSEGGRATLNVLRARERRTITLRWQSR